MSYSHSASASEFRAPLVPRVASRSRRAIGAFIDGVSSAVAWMIVVSIMGASPGSMSVRAGVWQLVLYGLYEVGGVALFGKTLGKVVVHTKVVDADDGGPVDWSSAFLRWLVPATAGIVSLAVPGLGFALSVASIGIYLPVLWNARARGLHDRAAHTIVIAD